jgi:hypothetical protein
MIAAKAKFALAVPLSAALLLPVAGQAKNGLQAELALSARLVLAENKGPVDDDIADGSLAALRIEPTLLLTAGGAELTFRNAATRFEYFDAARTDRWQNNARLTAALPLGGASTLRLFGERSDNILTAEALRADEWEFGGEVEHSLTAAHRLSLGARWRERSYDDGLGSKGRGPRVELEYRYRFAANHYAFARGRFEQISSANDRRDLERWVAAVSYVRPLARDLRLSSGLSWTRQSFAGRALAGGGVRRDTVWSPDTAISYSPGAWRLSAQARYNARRSSDPAFDRNGTRFTLEVGHVF